MYKFSLVSLILLSTICFIKSNAQTFSIVTAKLFTPVPEKKKIVLLSKGGTNLILFKTNLAVNTDGIPISYHPYDLRGESIAINSITNGVYITRLSDSINLCVPNKSKSAKVPKGGFSKQERSKFATEAFTVFEQWRDAGYPKEYPKGYKISWKSVLIEKDGKPCILTTGKYKGYFASATALKNGLTTDKGECDCNNQVDPFEIPALVLAASDKNSTNPARTFGANVGDLLVAYNPANKKLVYAIIGDSGPADNLGEGSVILNMKLLDIEKFPTKKSETYDLATKNNIITCIIPKSKGFELTTPYTQSNIKSRILNWFSKQGIVSEDEIISFLEFNKTQFD